jgi:phosphinothricin acetyltransferase
MPVKLEPLSTEHGGPVIDIFNHYIEHTFAAFLEDKVPYPFFNVLLRTAEGYPAAAVKTEAGDVVGFGLLRPHSPLPTTAGTAEISSFLHPDHCGRGIGGILLDHLLEAAAAKGIHTVLAAVSAVNEPSIRFHRKHGFVECGRFREVFRKKSRYVDTVWMQRMLTESK